MTSLSSIPCHIHLVRHGTTPLNVHGRYRSRLEVPLDETGWEDAHEAARALADVGLSTVYTSPLRRARDTARTISEAAGLGAITDVALLAIEGERDDISGLGQTRSALTLATNLPADKKRYYMAEGAGHYGIFNGSKWRTRIAPVVEEWMAANG